jgi:hypothetical protein
MAKMMQCLFNASIVVMDITLAFSTGVCIADLRRTLRRAKQKIAWKERGSYLPEDGEHHVEIFAWYHLEIQVRGFTPVTPVAIVIVKRL